MLCSECKKNEATVNVIKIVNGHKTELHLCSSCVKKFEQQGFFQSLDEHLFAPFSEFVDDSILSDRVCPACGTTLSQFNQTGYLGCEKCYEEFKPEIEVMLKRVQVSSSHVGKVPKGSRDLSSGMREYERLSLELKKAVGEERYEDAAKIKLKIKKLMEK